MEVFRNAVVVVENREASNQKRETRLSAAEFEGDADLALDFHGASVVKVRQEAPIADRIHRRALQLRRAAHDLHFLHFAFHADHELHDHVALHVHLLGELRIDHGRFAEDVFLQRFFGEAHPIVADAGDAADGDGGRGPAIRDDFGGG